MSGTSCISRNCINKNVRFGVRTFTNHNKLLWRYDGCIGLKTGYTEKAGRTLVSAAKRNNMTLICVTLNDPDDWNDHAQLFDYGFSEFHLQQVLRAGERAGDLPVFDCLSPFCPILFAESCTLPLTRQDSCSVDLEWIDTELMAPVKPGQKVGRATITLNGEEWTQIDLIAGQNRNRNLAPKPEKLSQLWAWITSLE